jgi:non-specific serine/threonine protein kinase/serine/threonine-protein kinase
MTPDRWHKVKSTLAAALEQPDEKERAEFLASACADDTALRREVESLLEQPEDQFDSVAQVIGVANVDPLSSASVGRRIGAYELVRELGRGGMGTVWLAKRADQQFEKLVAIKLLKRGTDTDEVLRRFRAERQILARLEHLNIARLLDGGITDDALPYFVMEYVEGKPVTEFCRANALTIEERLRLFLKICAAVEFAHQNLVVHRDLKPGNILVTEDCEPKLLDFGIAKLLAPGDGAWEMTMAGRERLTPGYASPEQVRGEPVTTVSDVYALGTLLYEVLTEHSAHRFSSSHPTATQILRVVCDEQSARPSTAVTEPALRRQLRGDLDTIILRALTKAPQRRYRGVGELADDLRRYLEDRPVRARPDTLAYRVTKFLKRNKLAAVAASLLLVTLTGGIVATTLEAQAADRQRARAERRFNDVRKIANSLMLELHNSIKDIPGALAARQLVTRRALEYLDSLAQETGNDLSLKSELATAYGKIGLVTFDTPQAISSHEKAAALNEELVRADPKNAAYRKQLSESYNNLSDQMKISGHSAQSIDYAKKSLAVIQSLATDNSGEKEIQLALADRHLVLGLALIDAGYFKPALQSDLQAMAIQQEVVARHPSDKEALRDLAGIYGTVSNAYEDSGDYATALEYCRKSLDTASEMYAVDPSNTRSRRDMWAAFLRTGRQLTLTGDTTSALQNYAKATQLIEDLAAADPQDRGHRRWLAVTYLSVGELFAKLDQPGKALENYRKAIAISEEVFAADPDRAETLRDLARMHEAMALLLAHTDQTGAALECFNKAESMANAAANHDPQNIRVRIRLVRIRTEMAGFYRKLADARGAPIASRSSNLRAARNSYQRSIDIWQDLGKMGMLSTRDAGKSDEAAREIANCDAALNSIEREKTAP